MLRVILTSN